MSSEGNKKDPTHILELDPDEIVELAQTKIRKSFKHSGPVEEKWFLFDAQKNKVGPFTNKKIQELFIQQKVSKTTACQKMGSIDCIVTVEDVLKISKS